MQSTGKKQKQNTLQSKAKQSAHTFHLQLPCYAGPKYYKEK